MAQYGKTASLDRFANFGKVSNGFVKGRLG